MKIFRALLFLPGLAALAYGGFLFYDWAFPLNPVTFQVVAWVVAAPVVHDAVLAPVIGVAAFALSRFLPRPWKVPVIAGAASSGVLAIVAFPLLWRDFAAAYPPGGHADPDIGLIVALAVVWAVVLVVGTFRLHRASPRPVQPEGAGPQPLRPTQGLSRAASGRRNAHHP